MLLTTVHVLLALAFLPFIYLCIALYSACIFFRRSRISVATGNFTPPLSILKPVRGIDPDAYENFASFCRQDYPEYEIVFCVGNDDYQAIAAIERLKSDFSDVQIRLLFSSRQAVNDKVAKLVRLVAEAKYEYLAISDSDVRVQPNYLRSLVAPMADPKVGGVTCFYGSVKDDTFADKLQTIGMFSDFYAGIIVARQLDGVKFALGQTIVTTRSRIAAFGGYPQLENRPGDDLLVGRFIAEQGYNVELLPFAVATVSDYKSIRELLQKRLRWIVVMRHMRPWGHLGLLLTHALPWSIVAVAIHPTVVTALLYFGTYGILRLATTWTIGVWGLGRHDLFRKAALIPVWDVVAFSLWMASFLRSTIRWRGGDYYIRDGMLVPATSGSGD